MTMFHIEVTDNGTVFTFRALDEATVEWIEENVLIEPWQGDASLFHADHRPARALIEALAEEGFTITVG